MRKHIILLIVLLSPPVMGMEFSLGGSEEACRNPESCKQWIYAAGEIKKDTPGLFLKFINQHEFAPHLVRFNSPGGNLFSAIVLGKMLREKEFDTEAEVCASACAYSFLGGVKRDYVDEKSSVGVHRFYNNRAAKEPTSKQFIGEELDGTQKVMSGLMLYVMEMGVDLKLIALTGEAGPGEMRWLTKKEATDLNVIYDPQRWSDWKIETTSSSPIALSVSQDNKRSMQITCDQNHMYFTLIDDEADLNWFRQCAADTFNGSHTIMGKNIPNKDVTVDKWYEGGVMTFKFQGYPENFSAISLFSINGDYPMSCTDLTRSYVGNANKLQEVVRLVWKSCN